MSLWGQQKAIETLRDRLTKAEDTCAELQRDRRKLDLEFTDLYDKVSRQMSRMAKRYAVDQKENGEQLPAAEPDDGLDPISRGIHLRRSYLRVKP